MSWIRDGSCRGRGLGRLGRYEGFLAFAPRFHVCPPVRRVRPASANFVHAGTRSKVPDSDSIRNPDMRPAPRRKDAQDRAQSSGRIWDLERPNGRKNTEFRCWDI